MTTTKTSIQPQSVSDEKLDLIIQQNARIAAELKKLWIAVLVSIVIGVAALFSH